MFLIFQSLLELLEIIALLEMSFKMGARKAPEKVCQWLEAKQNCA